MSQAEIAGGRLTGRTELPEKGRRLPDIELPVRGGGRVRLSDYRGRRNLVVVAIDDKKATTELISELAQRYEEVRSWEAEVVAIASPDAAKAGAPLGDSPVPFSILLDAGSEAFARLGALDAERRTRAALYVTDRFGEVFAAYRTREGKVLPTAADVLKWLEFVDSQCPECEPPEWPM